MAQFPRGIAPSLLLSQVRNTMPYLFEEGLPAARDEQFPPAKILRESSAHPDQSLNHFEYFRLCLSAHYSTCATPVPTDVDNQIRMKLWAPKLPLETALEMTRLILASRKWDFTLVSSRYTCGVEAPWATEPLSGHLGEWFTVACAAYSALGRYPDPEAKSARQEIFEHVGDEANRHSEIFGTLWRAKEGLLSLKACANIAHNFGDLDRVMDMWALPPTDPLRLEHYKLGATPFYASRKLRYQGRLWVAGELYKSVIDGGSMSFENHRHFALRKPKCLRRNRAFLIPIAPFFDDWGLLVAQALRGPDGKPSEDTQEVMEALQYGWSRLPNTVAYGRALRGFLQTHPELKFAGVPEVKKSRQVVEMSRERFEKRWSEEALRLMDEIPSRA
jgi:hypothetical protein